MQIMWIKLLFPCFLMSAAESGSHSLEFLSTGRVQPGDRPQFEQLTVFDGVPISYCDSFTRREEFKPSLESKNLPKDCNEARYHVVESLNAIPQLLNNTVYVVQRRRGCIQSANGDVSVFEAWAVNGMGFMSFDPESKTWTSHSPSAVTLKHYWNNNSPRNFNFRDFISQRCPEMIQRIKLKSTHQKTELRVFAKPTVNRDQALLRCHVTTTDKSVTSVHLTGDGASKAIWITVTGPVPSEDGSVILRLTAGISLRENTNKYGCTVQRGGHDFTVYWDGNTLDGRYLLNRVDWKILLLIGFFCAVLLCTVIYGAIIIVHKCVETFCRPSRVDRGPTVLFTRITTVDSYPQGTERSTAWEQWVLTIPSEERNFYDPECFADQVQGVLR